MGATVRVNGRVVGTAANQFLRYNFPLNRSDLTAEGNAVEVAFSDTIACEGRWMACSGGWNWAPYTRTSQNGVQTFTRGIWKSVYVAGVGAAAIDHFVPHVFYNGAYPTAPLGDASHGGFDVRARVHLWAPEGATGVLSVSGAWGSPPRTVRVPVTLPPGRSNVTVTLTARAGEVRLWWPAGAGAQPLYSKGRAAGEEGSAGHGMYFRVNGAVVLSRGANMIPMEELEGWLDAGAHTAL
eukprot:gene23191-26691_t